MAQFTNLPTEILLLITEAANPLTLLNIACTCQFFYNVCSNILQQHQNAYRKYRVSSDLSPATVPELLRDAIQNGINAWHVRSFENWGLRETWEDWDEFRPLLLSESMLLLPDTPESSPVQSYFIDDEDFEVYLGLLRDRFCMAKQDLEQAAEELRQGNDGILKALLFAMCPRLRSLKFVRGNDGGTRDSCLAWLTHIIETCWREGFQQSNSDKRRWPCGFENIHEIAIGVSSGTYYDRRDSQYHSSVAYAIMKLPALKSLYFHGLRDYIDDENYDNDRDWPTSKLPAGSSSVEQIFFDGTTDFIGEGAEVILAAPRALRALCLRGTGDHDRLDHVDIYVNSALAHTSIQSLMMYGGEGLRGFQFTRYLLDDVIAFVHPNLRQLFIDSRDLMRLVDTFRNLNKPKSISAEEHRRNNVILVAQQFPEPLEVLVVGYTDPTDDEELEYFLTFIIESGLYLNLMAIYIQAGSFKHLIEVADAHDVDVHVPGNKKEMRYQLEFPCGLKPTYLKTGPLATSRDFSDMELDVFDGCWKSKDPTGSPLSEIL